ncbi:MAG TPA: type-F conjugative transfer system secretin TraK, partial [Candidatus Babeliales bacterium]|nr:type-F conjugative transfer system secretin TraK [Candidatus Babeliales bacterium]
MINKPLEKHGIEVNAFLTYFLMFPLLLIFFLFLLVLSSNTAFAKDAVQNDFTEGSVTTATPGPGPGSGLEPKPVVPETGPGPESKSESEPVTTIVNNKSLDITDRNDTNDSNNLYENNLNKDLERTPQGTSQSVNKNNNKHSTPGVTVGAAAKTVAPIKENHDVNETNDISDLEHKAETTGKAEKTKESKENIKSNTVISHKQNSAKAASSSSSVKEIPFADNEQINVFLSNRDINRILVKGDKIQGINGPTGLYTAKNDTTGSAYISLYGDITFTIFASTLKGHNFSLLVTPRSIPGKTIILEPTTPSFFTGRVEEADSYQKMLIALI